MSEQNKINFAVPEKISLYREINPNINTIPSAGYNIVFFNSGQLQDDNAFYAMVLDLYQNGSSTFSNLINLKRNLLIGKGLVPANSGDTATQAFIDHENSYGDNLNAIWTKLCYDYSLFDSFSVQTVYNSLGQITDVYHTDLSTVRAVANSDDYNDTNVYTYMLSNNWPKITNKSYRRYSVATHGTPINTFNPKSYALDGGRQILISNSYTPGNNFYTIPSYSSVLGYVKLDLELQKFHLNSVERGFFPASIINMIGNPSLEEKTEFVNKFKNKYVGSDGEKLLFLWSDSQESKPGIIPLNFEDNTIFEVLNKITTQKICTGLGCQPELAGIQTEGQSLGGDANKIATSYNFFIETVIKPYQKKMLDTLNKIMKVNGLGELSVTTPPLNIDNNVNQNTVN